MVAQSPYHIAFGFCQGRRKSGTSGNDYFRVGSWNVQSLRDKELEVRKKYWLEVLGLSEMHLRGCGEREIGESVMIYSGVSKGRVKGGVAVIISGESRQYAKEWMCANKRHEVSAMGESGVGCVHTGLRTHRRQ